MATVESTCSDSGPSGALNRTESIGGLAADTNGELITDSANRLDAALDKLGAPNNNYYIVAFQPSPEAMNDPSLLISQFLTGPS